ncbi:ABC-F family ATP-binding cassette domain-containing protein [Loigolactobacillus zhaoyuanensis]|uniref:ABC-F family ATP-binding cassette domain-containing protein n=1 Tax=Loigolactobacillus zhaoyuanensis TaxID=2486017 RepID=A0ABW8UEM3_9LACO|nr:ABC-F family ATP-binding cassette domain-containing protein [Loigolactobacillus zhaoyuanensis]
MILLQAQNVARRFGAEVLFENVQLEVQSSSRVALVGRNGIGKSTLLKILIDQNPPDEGQVVTSKGVSIGYLSQDTGLDSQHTIFAEMLTVFADLRQMEQQMHQLEAQLGEHDLLADDEAYQLALKRYEQLQHTFTERNGYGYEAEIRNVLHGFGFDADFYEHQVSTLSGGQKSRLALAKLLLEKHDLLILDEPTNHLDIDTLTWLENYLQGYPGALLIVSHDQYFLDKVANEVYDLSQHTTRHYRGNYTRYREQKAANLTQEWKAYEKQQAEIAKLQDFVDKNIVRASTTKRAQSRRKQLEKIQRIERPQNDDKTVRFSFTADKSSGNQVLDVTNAAVGYADTTLADPINLQVKRHQVIAITGPNGVGKSTLLKSILGQIPFLRGQAQFGTGVDVGYYDQEQEKLHRDKNVLNEIWDEHPTLPEVDIRRILGSFLFTGSDVEKSVASLSGGERAQLMLVKLAMNHNNFLILDEPTNHLDIDSKEVLEEALLNYDGTILFVSHDRYFMNHLATLTVELSRAGTQTYLGNYDYYLDKKAEAEAIAAEKAPVVTATATSAAPSTDQQQYQLNKEQQKQERKLQREIAALEAQIETLAQQDQQLQLAMTQPDTLQDPAKLTELQQQLETVNQQQQTVEDQWEQQSLALEELHAE